MLQDDFNQIIQGDGGKGLEYPSKEIESLENKVQSLEKQNNELKFYWITSLIFVFDAFIFSNHQSWGGPIAVLIFELIFIIGISKKLDIEYMANLTDKIFNVFENYRKTGNKNYEDHKEKIFPNT